MKTIILIILIFALILLGFIGYIYLHSKEVFVKDTDGKNIYQKGFILKRTLLGYTNLEGDVCVDENSANSFVLERGNAVLEKFLWDENEDIKLPGRALFTYNLFQCPKGCFNGACIK